MKQNLLLFFCSMLAWPTNAQEINFWNRSGDVFDLGKYPSDSFEYRQMAFDLNDFKVIVTHLHYSIGDATEDQAWVEQWLNGNRIKSRYLGGISSGESAVGYPVKQWFQDYFILNKASEFTGVYYLIYKDGRWFELPGNYLTINHDKTALYTFVPEECGGCYAGTYLFDKQAVIKKYDTGGSGYVPEGVTEAEIGNLFKDNDWIWLKW